jgi:predicted short-subunit dehydrogenase-like oxidoreductase (DUF2520 family)
MNLERIQSVGMIGSGNLATHLCHAITAAGIKVSWVYSRTEEHAQKLANNIKTLCVTQLRSKLPQTDLIIICASDDAVPKVIKKLGKRSCMVVHTCGAVPMDVLSTNYARAGVLYPVQTFTAGREVNMREVTFCIETSDLNTGIILRNFASAISDHVVSIDSDQRFYLHIAAIFANNFSNYMYILAADILKQKNLPFNLLDALIKETGAKALDISPYKAQTGPAVRKDTLTMKKHLSLLKYDTRTKELYKLLSRQIINKNISNG